jgi:hypothetical protein
MEFFNPELARDGARAMAWKVRKATREVVGW